MAVKVRGRSPLTQELSQKTVCFYLGEGFILPLNSECICRAQAVVSVACYSDCREDVPIYKFPYPPAIHTPIHRIHTFPFSPPFRNSRLRI